MKNLKYLIAALLIVFICCFVWYISKNYTSNEDKTIYNKYTSDMAKGNGDVVDVHGNITNLEKLDNFIVNTKKGKQDTIRIVRYTIEGDPIIQDLNYDGKVIQYTYDNLRDKFGPTNKGIFSTQAMSIEKGITEIEIQEGKTKKYNAYYLIHGLDGREKREILLVENNE